MKYDFFQDRDNAGKTIARKLSDTLDGDMSSFRTVIRKTADGTETMLRTKGGMPEITVHRKPVEVVEPEERTFVFRIIGASSGVIANRFGAGMALVKSVFALVGNACGTIGNLGKSSHSWRDVWRIDQTPRRGLSEAMPSGKIAIQVNGTDKASTGLIYVPDFGPSAIPRFAGYSRAVSGDAVRSALFIGFSDGTQHSVASIKTDGTVLEQANIGTWAWWNNGVTCGLRLDSNGSFYIYGGRVFNNDGMQEWPYDTLYSMAGTWAKITTAASSPYLTVDTGGHSLQAIAYAPWNTVDLPTSWGHFPPADVATSRVQQVDTSYGYAGTDVAMTHTLEYDFNFVQTNNILGGFSGSAFNKARTEGRLTMRGVIASGVTGGEEVSPGEKTLLWYRYTYDDQISRPVETRLVTYSERVDARSVDLIYADIEEGVFLWLECRLWGTTEVVSTVLGGAATTQYSGEYVLSWVLSIRGVEYRYSHNQPSLTLEQGNAPRGYFGFWTTRHTTIYTQYDRAFGGVWPIPLLNPAYMSQSNCKFIAYTTRAEEAAGATPEFYLDMQILPSRYYLGTAHYGESGGVVSVCCHQLIQLFRHFLQTCLPSGVPYRNADLWEALFPPASPMRIQFCNGRMGEWSEQLGPGYSGNPHMDISRI